MSRSKYWFPGYATILPFFVRLRLTIYWYFQYYIFIKITRMLKSYVDWILRFLLHLSSVWCETNTTRYMLDAALKEYLSRKRLVNRQSNTV